MFSCKSLYGGNKDKEIKKERKKEPAYDILVHVLVAVCVNSVFKLLSINAHSLLVGLVSKTLKKTFI